MTSSGVVIENATWKEDNRLGRNCSRVTPSGGRNGLNIIGEILVFPGV